MRITKFLFLVISCVLSLQFPAAVDKRIRSTLLVALKRFHLNGPAPCINKPALSPMHRVKLENLPMDLMNQEVGSLLDFNSMINLRKTSINSKALSDSILKFHLAKFSHHFVFNDFLLNGLFKYVLEIHFPESSNLSSPSIKDEMQVLILKFNYGYLNYNAIPRNIYFYIISFIYEFVNGPNSLVPISKDLCLLESIRLVFREDYPRTLNYIRTLGFGAKFYEILDLILAKPSKVDLLRHLEILGFDLWWESKEISDVLKIFVMEAFINDLSPEFLLEFFKSSFTTSKLCVHSPVFMDRILSDFSENGLNIMASGMIQFFPFDSMYSLCSQYPYSSPDCVMILEKFARQLPLEDTVIPSRTLLDSKSMSIKASLNIFKYFYFSINIYQVDLFSQCINSPHISAEFRSRYFSSWLPYPLRMFFLDVSVKENPRPFNLFYVTLNQMTPVYFIAEFDTVTLSTFFELLNSRDPILLLLVMNTECFIASKPYITDKFDLNKTYRFCDDFFLNSGDFFHFYGRTMHFKQIVKELNWHAFQEVFSSNPHEFDGEFLPSEPVISIDPNFGAEYFTGW
jgi:hypothetical protein